MIWCPLALLQPSLLCSVAIHCPREKTKEQQGGGVWCIVRSSVIHTEISVKSVVGASGCVIQIVISILPSILFIKVLVFPPG